MVSWGDGAKGDKLKVVQVRKARPIDQRDDTKSNLKRPTPSLSF